MKDSEGGRLSRIRKLHTQPASVSRPAKVCSCEFNVTYRPVDSGRRVNLMAWEWNKKCCFGWKLLFDIQRNPAFYAYSKQRLWMHFVAYSWIFRHDSLFLYCEMISLLGWKKKTGFVCYKHILSRDPDTVPLANIFLCYPLRLLLSQYPIIALRIKLAWS